MPTGYCNKYYVIDNDPIIDDDELSILLMCFLSEIQMKWILFSDQQIVIDDFRFKLFLDELKELHCLYDRGRQFLVIKKPSPYVDQNFTITLGK